MINFFLKRTVRKTSAIFLIFSSFKIKAQFLISLLPQKVRNRHSLKGNSNFPRIFEEHNGIASLSQICW